MAVKNIEVDGIKFEIDTDKANSWEAYEIMSAQNNTLEGVIALAEFVTGKTRDELIEARGGKGVPAKEMAQYFNTIVSESYPKN